MRLRHTWTDIYSSVHGGFEGRAGGYRWMVAAPPELAAEVPAELLAVDGKGSVNLLVHDGLTPLLAFLRELTPRGVLIVAPSPLAAGPAVTVVQRIVEGESTRYCEGGAFPAWQGALAVEEAVGKVGACEAASAATSLGVPVVVTSPKYVRTVLEAWMDTTPHGRC